METNNQSSDVIDLGAATAETKGPVGPRADELAGKFIEGLSDD